MINSRHPQEPFQLLQLPGTALDLVLQQLDQFSLARTAMACSKLRHAVPAAISSAVMRHNAPNALDSFDDWLERHSSSLNKLTQCSVAASRRRRLGYPGRGVFPALPSAAPVACKPCNTAAGACRWLPRPAARLHSSDSPAPAALQSAGLTCSICSHSSTARAPQPRCRGVA